MRQIESAPINYPAGDPTIRSRHLDWRQPEFLECQGITDDFMVDDLMAILINQRAVEKLTYWQGGRHSHTGDGTLVGLSLLTFLFSAAPAQPVTVNHIL